MRRRNLKKLIDEVRSKFIPIGLQREFVANW